MEVHWVVAVPPEHVRLDEVGEDQPVVNVTQELLGLRDAFDVRFGRMRLIDVKAGEDLTDLADPVNLPAGVAHEGQVIRTLRLEREIAPVRGPLVRARLADER